jgi:ABC-2 type transport system ATP-binding protein
MGKVIETKDLTKKFGRVTAVENVNLSVGKGEIFGFIGLNGAGKTTTIRMLLGMIRPTAGTCFLAGRPVQAEGRALWSAVGHLVEIPYSYPDLTVRENLEMVRRLRLLPDTRVVDKAIERLRLGPYRDRAARHLSLGNAQRLGLARAIMHAPAILILDEPANGLDPAGIVEIRDLLLDMAQNRGVTILVSSHILGEVSKFASRIGIIHEGRLVREMTVAQLDECLLRSLVVRTRDSDRAREVLASEGFAVTVEDRGLLRCTDRRALEGPEKLNELLVRAGFPPAMIMIEEEDLEQYFLRVIGRNGGAS